MELCFRGTLNDDPCEPASTLLRLGSSHVPAKGGALYNIGDGPLSETGNLLVVYCGCRRACSHNIQEELTFPCPLGPTSNIARPIQGSPEPNPSLKNLQKQLQLEMWRVSSTRLQRRFLAGPKHTPRQQALSCFVPQDGPLIK